MSKAIEAIKTVFATAAAAENEVKTLALAKVENAQSDEERDEFTKTAKRAHTHERYNEALASMSSEALQQLAKLKVDATALAAQSRELKKRSIAIVEAIAHSKRVDDRALDALLQRLAAKRDSKLSLEQIKREMQHETTTQAQYFKTCALFFSFAQYSKSEKELSFDYNASVLASLMSIYSA